MFKHSVVYQDFNRKPHNEELYFHMMVPEWADLQFDSAYNGDFGKHLTETMESGDGGKIYRLFMTLIEKSYGRRSEDGAEFHKNWEWTNHFFSSPAWEQMFLWLTDLDKDGKNANAMAFWTGITPPSFQQQADSNQTPSDKPIETFPDFSKLSRDEMAELLRSKLDNKG